jgi:hypothetical protein
MLFPQMQEVPFYICLFLFCVFQIKYGGLDDNETSSLPRTRGRKINYQEVAGSESEEVC